MHLRVLGVGSAKFFALGYSDTRFYVAARACFSVYIAALLHWTSLPNCKFYIDRELMEEREKGVRKEPVREEEEEARKNSMEGGVEEEAAKTQKREKEETVRQENQLLWKLLVQLHTQQIRIVSTK